jgi:hypothetical protein
VAGLCGRKQVSPRHCQVCRSFARDGFPNAGSWALPTDLIIGSGRRFARSQTPDDLVAEIRYDAFERNCWRRTATLLALSRARFSSTMR